MRLFGVMTAAMLMSGVLSAQDLPVNGDAAWFKPSLLVDKAPICADLLEVEQAAFFSTAPRADHERTGFKLIRGMYEDAVPDPQVEVIPDSFGQLQLTLPGQQHAIVYFHNNGGCGGGCETEQVLVADKVFDPPPARGHDLPATPLAAGWTLYKSGDGEFYALGYPEGNLQAYRVAPSLRAEIACEVKLQPSEADLNDAAVRSASQSLGMFRSALAAMSQGAGECGSLRAHWIRQRQAAEALQQSLYRPWGSATWQRNADELISSSDSWSERSDSIETHLAKWALSGVAEHRAFIRYGQQYRQTAAELSRLYRKNFGWSKAQADDAADRALHGVLERAFAFSSSVDRFQGALLARIAILERQSLWDIQDLYEAELEAAQSDPHPDAQYDSLLNAAIERPDVLSYLLVRGHDPNATNGFGKTPLMYAAQYDQLESARILLEAGARPNMATHPPEDTCFYTLKSSGVTALHYAVRYASVPLIRLLVSSGAATSSKARRSDFDPEEYPLDWLETYTERPRTEAELAELKQLLRVPGDNDRGL